MSSIWDGFSERPGEEAATPAPVPPLEPTVVEPKPDKPAIASVTNWVNGLVLLGAIITMLLGPDGTGEATGFVAIFGVKAAAFLAAANLVIRQFTDQGIGGFWSVKQIR